MESNAEKMKRLEEIVDGLEQSHKFALRMRRDMMERLEDVAESRDYWASEAASKLGQLEYYRGVLEMWRKGVPVATSRFCSSHPSGCRCPVCSESR